LGLVLKRTKISDVARQVLPLTWAGFAVMLASGALLFLSEAAKAYGNASFRMLILAGLNPLIFTRRSIRASLLGRMNLLRQGEPAPQQ
jgi:hypothetical protein